MADKRAFFKLDVGYVTNPKVAVIAAESPTAVIMHVASVAYCAQHLTDGVVPVKLITRLAGGTDDDAQLLIGAGLWHTDPGACEACDVVVPEGSAYVHDFLEHNRSAGDAKRVVENGRRGASKRWNGSQPNSQPNSHTNGLAIATPIANPMATPIARERERDTTYTSTKNDAFDVFYDAYPKHVGKQAAVKAFDKALKIAPADVITAGAVKYAASRQGEDPKYTKNPSTWLNQGCWEDEPVTKPQAPRQLGDDIWDRKGGEQ